jgi:hypothetical protein
VASVSRNRSIRRQYTWLCDTIEKRPEPEGAAARAQVETILTAERRKRARQPGIPAFIETLMRREVNETIGRRRAKPLKRFARKGSATVAESQ